MQGKTELRIGVIGAGGRGRLAEQAHDPENGVRVVAGADVDPDAFVRFRSTFGDDVLVTDDYRDVLARDDINAVFVTTPDYLHEEHAVASLNAGKAVYLEKPMAITIDGCDRILQAARDNGCRLYLGHNMRHMHDIRKLKEIVDSGRIGQVRAGWCRHFVAYGCDAYFKDWHAERAKSTGLLLQKGTHDIDVLHWLCGGYTTRVTAVGTLSVYNTIKDRRDPEEKPDTSWDMTNWPPLHQKRLNPVIDVEDLSMMLMELDNGVLCSYQQCHYTPDAWRNYTIIGTEGRVENFGNKPGACVIRVWNRRASYNPYGDEQHFIPPVSGGHGGADATIVQEFIRYVREAITTTTSPIAARNSVAAGVKATESLRSDSIPMDIPPVPQDVAAYFE